MMSPNDTLPMDVALRRSPLKVSDAELRWLAVIHPFVMTSGLRSQLGDLGIELYRAEDHSAWPTGPWLRIIRFGQLTGYILHELAVPLLGLASLPGSEASQPLPKTDGDALRAKLESATSGRLDDQHRALAQAAIKSGARGDWQVRDNCVVDDENRIVARAPRLGDSHSPGGREVALHIAANSPEVVLTYLDEIERLRTAMTPALLQATKSYSEAHEYLDGSVRTQGATTAALEKMHMATDALAPFLGDAFDNRAVARFRELLLSRLRQESMVNSEVIES